MGALLLTLLEQAALAAVAATGFGLTFAVPARMLALCAAGGAIGRGVRLLIGPAGLGVPIEWATLVAAATVSLLGVYVGRRLMTHPKVFTVAAMIPMIPGVPLFTALLAVAQMQQQGMTDALLASAVKSGLDAGFIVAALAVGLAMPGLLIWRRTPVM